VKRELDPDRLPLLNPGDRAGISAARVAQLRASFGDNRIAEHRPKSFVDLAGDAATDPMLWFLALTGGLFALLGKYTDAVILLLAIVPLVGMDFYLHRRTAASLEGLSSALATEALAIRDGQALRVPAAELVSGDLVRVGAGDRFPADGLILEGDRLQADESSLTGEAYPVAKHPLVTADQDAPRESNWAFAGTRLLTGEALFRVLFTGKDTLYGEIVLAASTTRRERTPLQQEVLQLVRALLAVALGACLLLAGVRLAQGYGPLDAFLSAAVLAVAAIPEEFPVVLTFFLGTGAYRLAQRKALVRRAVAVENIGRISAICTDKTGTITEGQLALHELRPASGVAPERLLELGRMASRAETRDPLDLVLLATGDSAAHGRLVASFPFTEARRREVAIWEQEQALVAVAKGAPETILDLCDLGKDDVRRVLADVATMSGEGQKVIACASRPATSHSAEPAGHYSYAGLIGISDPLREGVTSAVDSALQAGIRVVMVTGDHPRTAAAIAGEAGLARDPVILTGDELEEGLARGQGAILEGVDVVARATPAQKVLLVNAMRERGYITAVTGDGVNDVPALKAADVGIAMGLRGTQAAREVAAIVLLDDNFSTIVRAIAEGRQLFRNLGHSFAFLLIVHIPLVATAAVVPLLGYPLLYLPIHIVLLELLIHPAAIFGFQRGAEGKLTPDGRPGARRFFTRRQAAAIVGTGALIAFGVAGVFITMIERGEAVEHARAMGIVALGAAMIAVLAVLSRLRTTAPRVIAVAAAAAVVVSATIPGLEPWVHVHALGISDLLIAAGIGTVAALASALFQPRGSDQDDG
jgi:Ca2+-transporting ATPase